MFGTNESRVTVQKFKTRLVSFGVAVALLAYSLLSAFTPFVATNVQAGGGYDPYAPTVNGDSTTGGQSGGAGTGANENGESSDDSGEDTAAGNGQNQDGEENIDGESTAETCASFMGVCWYWWIPISAVVVGLVAFVLRQRREES